MSAGVIIIGALLAAIGGLVVSYPDHVPNSEVTPAAIESDPEAAAAQARRSVQLRGGALAVVGVCLLIAGFASMF